MLDEMKNAKLQPTLTTFNLLIRAAHRMGDEATPKPLTDTPKPLTDTRSLPLS